MRFTDDHSGLHKSALIYRQMISDALLTVTLMHSNIETMLQC